MKAKEYKIKTIEDIMKAVDSGNIDGFLKDFEQFLRMSIMARELSTPDLYLDITKMGFIWNDDGDYGTFKKISIELAKPKRHKKVI